MPTIIRIVRKKKSIKIFISRRPNNYDASQLGLKALNGNCSLSPFAGFWRTFLGYSFLDTESNCIRSKADVFYEDPMIAEEMARTLLIPQCYKLVDSPGWLNGELIECENTT